MSEPTGPVRARRLLLCATGAFQAYTLPGFVLQLLRHVADDVQVVLSRAASRLVAPLAVETASRHPVFVETEEPRGDVYVPHIELGRGVDLVLVFPATANVLGKVAQGITDELIPALIVATPAPVVFVPGMNPEMWRHPAVQRNVETLRGDGYLVLPPFPSIEVATREGLAESAEPFPYPTLQVQMAAILSGSSPAGRARRG